MYIREDFHVHDTLNPKIFNDNKLKADVRQKILQIVAKFKENLSIPIPFLDVHLVGSNASYNYTQHSDLDLHIVVNFEQVDANIDVVKSLYELEKTAFNKNHDITIKGIEAEIYVEDVRSIPASNGIYSVFKDNWIKKPTPIRNVKIADYSKDLHRWETKICAALQSNDLEKISNAIDALYLLRHNSLAVEGEYGTGNQLFKDIRNKGLLDKLKKAMHEAESQELSLEGLNLGQITNRL